jgi:signal transduction histidine kinase
MKAKPQPPAKPHRDASHFDGRIWQNRHSMSKVAFTFLALCVGLSLAAHATGAPQGWRNEMRFTRTLAENDAPRAYEQAQRLQAVLPPDARPADRALVLNLLARIEHYLALTAQAGNHARQALTLAQQNADRVGEAEAELNLCLITLNEGKIDAMITATNRAMALVGGLNRPDLLGETFLRTTMMYRWTGQLDEAITTSLQAMEIARRGNDPLVLTYAHQGLGASFHQSDRLEEAGSHFVQMREQARAASSKLLEADALLSLANTLTISDHRSRAESLIREAISLYRVAGAPFHINRGLVGLAHHLRNQTRYAEAQPLLDEVITAYGRHPNKIGLWHALSARSSNSLSLGNNAAAQTDAEQAHALAQAIGFPAYLSETVRLGAAIAAASGDHQRAYALSLEAADLTAKATREKITTRTLELAKRFEAEGERRLIDELTRRNEQQIAELRQRQMQQRWLWTISGGSIAALAVVAFFLRRLQRSHGLLRDANRQLQASRDDLQHQTGVLQSVLDSMSEGVCVGNEAGQLILVNPMAERILGIGITPGDPSGWSERYGLYLSDQTTTLYPAAELPLARAMRGESCDAVEIFVRNPKLAHGRWLSINARPLVDKSGVARGGVVVFSDTTARRQIDEQIRTLNISLEQRVRERTTQLEFANEELEAFSYSVSHDLRAPLRSMDGFSRILLEDYADKLDPEGVENLRIIRAASQRMGRLIDDMLRLAKVSRTELIRTTVDLSAMAGAVAAELKNASPAHAVSLVIEPGMRVQADANLIRIVLQNLLGNAWKFTSRHATAKIEFGRVESDAGPAHFIRDDGVGFDPEFSNKLFIPFQRLHTLEEFPGTGIGLATVQRIIQRHGGRVWAKSTPGLGAVFYFTIPN